MKYIIFTDHFNTRMYFMEHLGTGFSISTDRELAKLYPNLGAARIEANRLTDTTGMKAETEVI